MPENCNLEDVAHIRKFVAIPVVCAGRMDPETAAAAIADGKIDGAGFARQFLACLLYTSQGSNAEGSSCTA